jgi:predicted ferric reductase
MNRTLKKIIIYLVLVINLVIVVGMWVNRSGSLMSGDAASVCIGIGRLLGLLAECCILTQLVLIGRIRFVEQTFGFDKLNRLHRIIGYTLGSTILLHPFFITLGYSLSGRIGFFTQFMEFLRSWEHVLLAFIGLCILLTCVVISIAIIRRKIKYETWYFTHLFMYVAIGFFFWHQVETADVSTDGPLVYWYILNFTVFGLVFIYRFCRPLYIFNKYRFYIDKIVPETDTVNSFYIKGNHIETYKFEPGQYMHITFLRKGFWYRHPFSFSAAPNGEYLRLSIKGSGDFTNTIHTIAPGTHVMLDGPFGIFTEKTSHRDKYLFIAGGIGITPIRSMIEGLNKKGIDMILLYGNRAEKDIAFRKELEGMNVKITHVLSDSQDPAYEKGFIDKEKIARLAPDFMSREIYVCGPPIMMMGVVKTLKEMGVPQSQLHYERFSY